MAINGNVSKHILVLTLSTVSTLALLSNNKDNTSILQLRAAAYKGVQPTFIKLKTVNKITRQIQFTSL